MKQINNYILEKLKINNDIPIHKKSIKDMNAEISENLIKIVKEFFNKEVGDSEYELKFDKYNNVRVYIYEGGKERYQELADKFWKKYYNSNIYDDVLFHEVELTSYGIKIHVCHIIDPEDFSKKLF